MSLYEAEAMSRAIVADRLREAAHQRLARELRQSEIRISAGAATASASRRSRLWRIVHLSHAYG
jgi:Trm5-related predicted tRNA methylase